MKKIIAALIINCVFVGIAIAAKPYFKAPFEWAGTGCPANSASIVGENTSTLTVMFDRYDAGKGMRSVSGMPRTACSFAVPIHVPKGFQLSYVTAEWMGYTKGSTKLKRKYFFAHDPSGTMVSKSSTFPPPNGEDYLKKDKTQPYATCGPARDVIFRVNSSIQANGNPSYIAVDSVDLNNKLILHLKWVACP